MGTYLSYAQAKLSCGLCSMEPKRKQICCWNKVVLASISGFFLFIVFLFIFQSYVVLDMYSSDVLFSK